MSAIDYEAEVSDDEELSNVLEGLHVDNDNNGGESSPISVSSGNSGNPIELSDDENQITIVPAAGGNGPAGGNVFHWVSFFAVSAIYGVIMSFHEFRAACTSLNVFKAVSQGRSKKIINVSVTSNCYIQFMLALYDQFRQNAHNYMVREYDPALNAQAHQIRLMQRYCAFSDFVFFKDSVFGGNTQCCTRNFRNFILIPVLHDKYRIFPTERFPTHFGADTDLERDYFAYKNTAADAAVLPLSLV